MGKKWTVEEEEILKKYYKSNRKKCKKLLSSRSAEAINQKAFRMGISVLWTKEEDAMLEALSEKFTQSKVAKMIGRSKNAVGNRRKVLGIEPFTDTTDMYNFTQIAEMLGLHHSTISKVWVKNGFKYKKMGNKNYATEEEILKYMKNHPDCYDARNADYYLFYRHKWFLEKLEKDRKKTVKTKVRWTDYEKNRAKILKKRGLSYREIAEELGRTRKAVIHYFSKYGE